MERPGQPDAWAWPGRGSAATCRSTAPGRRRAETINEPNPRTVSRRLLTRDQSLVAADGRQRDHRGLAAVHDPGLVPARPQPHRPTLDASTLEGDDDWPAPAACSIMRTPDDPTTPSSTRPAADVRQREHALVGRLPGLRQQRRAAARSCGRARAAGCGMQDGMPPIPDDPERRPRPGCPGSGSGSAMLHHAVRPGAQRDLRHARRGPTPSSDDEQLFQKARLVNSALLAKIHTVEWTPAVTAHPTAVAGLHANWYGLAGQKLRSRFGRISSSEAISRDPGLTDRPPRRAVRAHRGVRRRLPDAPAGAGRLRLPGGGRRQPDARVRAEFDDAHRRGRAARSCATRRSTTCSTPSAPCTPGWSCLHNFPRALQNFTASRQRRADGPRRDRHHAVPGAGRARATPSSGGYLHMTVPKTFDELTSNPSVGRRARGAATAATSTRST